MSDYIQNGTAYLISCYDKNFRYKFFKPFKHYVYVKTISSKKIIVEIRVKTQVLVICSGCSFLFVEKINTSSELKISLKKSNNVSKENVFKINISKTFNILKEEAFLSLPFLAMHHHKNCNMRKKSIKLEKKKNNKRKKNGCT